MLYQMDADPNHFLEELQSIDQTVPFYMAAVAAAAAAIAGLNPNSNHHINNIYNKQASI